MRRMSIYQTNYYGSDKSHPFIGYEGSSQQHNHSNTSTESNVPVNVVAYFICLYLMN